MLNSSVNSYRRLDPHYEAPNQIKARITSYNVCYTKLLRDTFPDWRDALSRYLEERLDVED